MSKEELELAGTSAASVEKATGRNWEEWVKFLDKKNAELLSHKEIALLLSEYIDSGWWCQKITVGYEQHKGKRVLGQTADAAFQIGVSKTIDFPKEVVWELIISNKGMETWLGNIDGLNKNNPKSYSTADGVKGDINVLKPYSHLRLTWHPKTWDKKSTLQLRLTDKGQKTVLTFHHEGLPSAKERVVMRGHWIKVAERLLQLLEK